MPKQFFARRSPAPPRREITRWRIQVYGLLVVAAYLFLFAGLYKTGWWILDAAGRPRLSDFTPMWIAGREALHGNAAAAYDFARFVAAQTRLAGPSDYPWPYPPVFFLVAALVALIPYAWSYVIWQAATVSAVLTVGYRIIRDRATLVAMLASPLLLFNAAVGQNGCLTAALLGGALVFVERRPLLAGALLGCLGYKPQFALVLPVALAASGRWRVLGSAVAAAAALAALATAAFGAEIWQAFPAALGQRANSALAGQFLSGKIQSVYLLLRFAGLADRVAAGGQIVIALAALAALCAIWRSPASHNLKSAAAAAATLLATPYLYVYDMVVLVPAGLFLAADLIEAGSSRAERVALFALFVAQFAVLGLADKPLGSLLTLALFAFTLRRWRSQPGPVAAAIPGAAQTQERRR